METLYLLSIISVVSLVVCLGLLPWLVVRLPEDYFARERRDPDWADRSLARKLLSILRCLVGLAFVIVGALLVLLPGQGLLTILVGVLVAEFPGKFRLERNLARRPGVRAALDRIRAAFDHPPLRHE